MKDSIIIGLSQAIAIIPGVSRSGITITAGLNQGLGRKEAARFSFLLSTPIILGAAAFQAKGLFEPGVALAQVSGILAAATSGYLAIAWLIKFVGKSNYAIFFWYRLALALVIIVMTFFVK
jgi:undecaprenyl-diphosphatase